MIEEGVDEEAEQLAQAICHQCQSSQPIGYKFCGNCGTKNLELFKQSLGKDLEYQENFRMLAVYAAVVAAALILNYLVDDSLVSIVAISVGFAIIDLIFASQQPSVWKVLFKRVSLKPLLWIIPAFCGSGFLVSYSIDHLNSFLFDANFGTGYIDYFQGTDHPLLYTLIIVAVFPAIFEELAFRGFLFNNFKKINGEKAAVWGSSFLFALVHFSLLSILWIFPFGLILARMRNRYSTIFYGMVAHFLHNGTVTVIEHYFGSLTY